MQIQTKIKWLGYILSLLTLIFGFTILYNDTQQIFGSLSIAALGALMVWGTFIIIGWLARVMLK